MHFAQRIPAAILALGITAAPAAAQWSETSMPQPQSEMATARAGPYLLHAGGRGNTSLVQAYDTLTDTWVPSRPLIVGRKGLSGVTVGSRAVFSGGHPGGFTGLPWVDVYDSSIGPPSDPSAWSTLTLPNPRCAHASAAVGSKVIIARGISGGANPIASADIYDFSTGAWTTVPLSAGGAGAVAVTLGTQVLIAGGIYQFGPPAGVVDIYDDATGTWSTAMLSEARGGGAGGGIGATTVGSLAIFAGGRRDWFGSSFSTAVDIYDASTGSWSSASLSRGRDGIGVGAVGDRVVFAGGDIVIAPGASDAVDILDLGTGRWSTSTLAAPRGMSPPLVHGDSIWFAGGFEGSMSSQSARVEIFTLPDVDIRCDAPDTLDPHGAAVPVELIERTPGVLVPGSATLHYDTGAGTVQTPLVPGGPTGWVASFPPLDCGTQVTWYVSAASTGGATLVFPDRAPATRVTSRVTDQPPVLAFHMDAVDGWISGAPGDTATAGVWERGDPFGTEAQSENDHTPGPGGACWATGLGTPLGETRDHDVDGGATTLLSPALDLTAVPDPWIGYWRWTAGTDVSDQLVVSVTDDGVNWVEVETVQMNPSQGRGGWFRHDFRVLDMPGIVLTDSVRVRFVAEDRFGDSIVEVAIDDVVVSSCSLGVGGLTCLGVANSTGVPSRLVAAGSRAVVDDDVTLMASDLPLNAAGFFLVSRDSGLTTVVANSMGTLCLAGAIGRYVGPGQVQSSGTAGAFSLVLDLAATPTPTGLVSIVAGEAWHFQAWHRDVSVAGATSNFTNGYVIPFE